MLFAYRSAGPRLERLSPEADLAQALWIDLYRPTPAQVEALTGLGVPVPTLDDMEEIEISSRLYHEDGMEFLTVVLPGLNEAREQVSGPVTFILGHDRLVTVRHHAPRPFETYPERANRVSPGCHSPKSVFLSLVEEIIGRLADLLEGTGKALDGVSRDIYAEGAKARDEVLLGALKKVGREGDLIGRVRLALLTLERALGFFTASEAGRERQDGLRAVTKALLRDIQSLEVHADFLSQRVAMAADAALGIINLGQSQTIKIFSVLAVIFLPPTVIASSYGMNFEHMPELGWVWGYPMALGLMVASAVGTFLFFKWKHWL
jgi:magnesium transporter